MDKLKRTVYQINLPTFRLLNLEKRPYELLDSLNSQVFGGKPLKTNPKYSNTNLYLSFFQRLIQGFVSPILANTVDLVLKSLTVIDVSVLPAIKAETVNFLLVISTLITVYSQLRL